MHRAQDYNAVRLKENFQLWQWSGENVGGEIDERRSSAKIFQVLKKAARICLLHIEPRARKELRTPLAVCGDIGKTLSQLHHGQGRKKRQRLLLRYFLLYFQGFWFMRSGTHFFMASRSTLTAERQYL